MKLSDLREAMIKTADALDAAGFHKEASEMDKLIKEASLATPMIRALKSDDADAANKALFDLVRDSKNPAQELGLTDADYKGFAYAVKSKDLGGARQFMGVGKDTPQPAPQSQPKPSSALVAELMAVKPFIIQSQGQADRDNFFTHISGDTITVDAGLTWGGMGLVKELSARGFKIFVGGGGDIETMSKIVDGKRILIDVGMGRGPDNTMISIEPVDKGVYDAVAQVFAPVIGPTATSGHNLAPLDFEEAEKMYDEYDPPPPTP